MMRKKIVCLTFCLLIVIAGCSSSEDTESGNPTIRIASLKAEPSEVAPRGNALVTAHVIKPGQISTEKDTADGTSTTATTSQINAWGVTVTFKLMTASGGRLSSSTQKTDGSGTATVVYTAGNNYYQDVVQAKLENENSATVIITKSGGMTGPVVSSVQASPSSVITGQQSVITIKVTDNENPVANEYVDVRILPNNSGASLTVQNPYTDAQGQVVAVYSAGFTAPVTDVVQARILSTGSANSIVISVISSAEETGQ